jgi:hypothetical protein
VPDSVAQIPGAQFLASVPCDANGKPLPKPGDAK